MNKFKVKYRIIGEQVNAWFTDNNDIMHTGSEIFYSVEEFDKRRVETCDSKGRGRFKNVKYYVMVNEDTHRYSEVDYDVFCLLTGLSDFLTNLELSEKNLYRNNFGFHELNDENFNSMIGYKSENNNE
jgi:hypothetical protein